MNQWSVKVICTVDNILAQLRIEADRTEFANDRCHGVGWGFAPTQDDETLRHAGIIAVSDGPRQSTHTNRLEYVRYLVTGIAAVSYKGIQFVVHSHFFSTPIHHDEEHTDDAAP